MFQNREEAGRKLSKKLARYKGKDVLVLALPRGGVVVGYEVAKELGAKFDVFISKKLGAPYNPEFGIGAVAEGGGLIVDKRKITIK